MIAFKEVTFLKNLTAETETAPWPANALYNSVPHVSVHGKPRHVYLTQNGILIYSPEKQVAVSWDEMFALAESKAPELLGEKPEKQTIIPKPPVEEKI